MENTISILDSCTYDPQLKKINKKISKKIKISDHEEKSIVQDYVLMEDTTMNPFSTLSTSKAFLQAT